jgi:hypothetical protein
MVYEAVQNEAGTHFDWELEAVTPKMLNWFWCNMEKCDQLWHPNQHMGLTWMIDVKKSGPIGSIHRAPQKWNDGKVITPYIRLDDPAKTPDHVRKVLKYDHAIIAVGFNLEGKEDLYDPETTRKEAYRIHQWQSCESGVVGMSSAIPLHESSDQYEDSSMIWAVHAQEEITNWEVYLPQLYSLYRVVEDRDICPYYSFEITGTGLNAQYKYL